MNSNINHLWIVNLQSQCLELQYLEYEINFPCYVLLDSCRKSRRLVNDSGGSMDEQDFRSRYPCSLKCYATQCAFHVQCDMQLLNVWDHSPLRFRA